MGRQSHSIESDTNESHLDIVCDTNSTQLYGNGVRQSIEHCEIKHYSRVQYKLIQRDLITPV